MSKKHEMMGKEDMTKLLIKFSMPAMIGLVVNALYNLVDRIYIGRIPETGQFDIGSIGITMPMSVFSFGIALMVGMGGSTLISLKLGQKKKATSEKYLGSAIVLGGVLAVIFCILTLIFMEPLLYRLGASENNFQGAKDYLSIFAYGYIFSIVGYVANASIRADGNPKISMYTLLIGAIINIVLDPIFIFMLGMGIKGAAVATVISQFASMAWALSYFIREKSGSTMKLYKENIKLNIKLSLQIMKQGLAPFVLQVGSGLVIWVLNKMLKTASLTTESGDLAVSAMTVVQGIVMFFVMPMFAINQAVLPLAGYNYGARHYSRVKGILLRAIGGAVSVGVIGFILIQIASRHFIYVFSTDAEVVEIATRGLKTLTIFFPLIGCQIVSSIYFQAIGKPKITMFLTLSRQVIFLIPLAIILGNRYGVMGVWYAAPISDFLSFVVTGLMVKRELNHLDKLIVSEKSSI